MERQATMGKTESGRPAGGDGASVARAAACHHLSFTVLSYREWLACHPEVELVETDCPECGGEGVTECLCCGSLVTCDLCEGTGRISDPWTYYREQMRSDLAALERWFGVEFVLKPGQAVARVATPRAARARSVVATSGETDNDGLSHPL